MSEKGLLENMSILNHVKRIDYYKRLSVNINTKTNESMIIVKDKQKIRFVNPFDSFSIEKEGVFLYFDNILVLFCSKNDNFREFQFLKSMLSVNSQFIKNRSEEK